LLQDKIFGNPEPGLHNCQRKTKCVGKISQSWHHYFKEIKCFGKFKAFAGGQNVILTGKHLGNGEIMPATCSCFDRFIKQVAVSESEGVGGFWVESDS